MVRFDVVVIGGGLAGSTAAAMLGRSGIATALIDPHDGLKPDFRCEKLDARQVELLRRTGLEDVVYRASTRTDSLWVARYGRLVDKKPNGQMSFHYHEVVAALRAEAARHAAHVVARATRIATGPDRQIVELSDGGSIEARLVVLASGLNLNVRRALGIGTEILSACHSVSAGFDIAAPGRTSLPFPALTYFPERRTDAMAYLTLFPIRDAMRANLFVYRDKDDPWLTLLRRSPEETLDQLMPHLRRLTGEFDVVSVVRARPVDLTVATGHAQDGIVLIGDAYSTSCPAAGTGASKVFTDAERLCRVHVPDWLSSPGMGADKIAGFYADPVKQACEADSRRRAFDLRAMSLSGGLAARTHRATRFFGHAAIGLAREAARSFGNSRRPRPALTPASATGAGAAAPTRHAG